MKAIAKSSTALAVVVVLACSFALFATGCSSPVGQDVSKRMDDLESRVKVLEDKLVTKADEGSAAVKTYSDTEDYATYDKYLSDIDKRVDEASVAAQAVSVPSDNDQKMREFDKAVIPLDNLEEELGHLEDAVEAAYANGYLTDDEYATLKSGGENLDSKIDSAINTVKESFGIVS